jgi:hypothetical protein
MRRTTMLGVSLAALLTMGGAARADLVFQGTGTDQSDGSALSAMADFFLIGSDFRIVLTNLGQPVSQGSVLTNLGVITAPTPAVALPSAAGTIALTSGSVFVGKAPANTLGEEWAYLSGGAASSGFGVGTGHGNLCGSTVCNGQALDGAAYGLVSTGTDLSPNGLQASKNAYVENSVTIDITLAANSTFTLNDITSVDFQFGTGPNEGDIRVTHCTGGTDCNSDPPSVPEPTSLAILGAGLIGLTLVSRKRGPSAQDTMAG